MNKQTRKPAIVRGGAGLSREIRLNNYDLRMTIYEFHIGLGGCEMGGGLPIANRRYGRILFCATGGVQCEPYLPFTQAGLIHKDSHDFTRFPNTF